MHYLLQIIRAIPQCPCLTTDSPISKKVEFVAKTQLPISEKNVKKDEKNVNKDEINGEKDEKKMEKEYVWLSTVPTYFSSSHTNNIIKRDAIVK